MTDTSLPLRRRVPVIREIMADLDTPLTTYLKLASGPWSYLLESVEGGDKWGRYSIIGLPCRERLEVRGTTLRRFVGDACVETLETADPLDWIARFHSAYEVTSDRPLPRFCGGLVGYFGYDTVRYVEPRLKDTCPPDTLGTPDILLLVSEQLVVFDNLSGTMLLITHVDPDAPHAMAEAKAALDVLEARLRAPVPDDMVHPPQLPPTPESAFVSSFGQDAFEAAVEKIRDYILAGDLMQCVISQRLSAPCAVAPMTFYRALRCLNPSPYMYCFDFRDFHVVGSSPEILAHVEDNVLTVRPIAGTRRRGRTEEEDRALEAELLADPKEIAEHLMLIDLGRNDVGRVSETGTVRVTDQMIIERYSHVMHIVSNVKGQLRPGVSAMDALKATLPAGTLSGAPKVRAMEIIDELEPVKRGIYGGAVGYLSFQGNMDTAIAIRTAVIRDGQIHIQAGAGVVADSIPRLEWKETLNKGRALLRALTLAENGLRRSG
ncbi:anthranilate synthase component I [Hahella sp. SMD15-11]|uniref:Anthranilate synthase component 1 n=1 Tax=Thermohahella caldifontis TaxID=3142973 RepID=A0AB39UVB2_9GAMM